MNSPPPPVKSGAGTCHKQRTQSSPVQPRMDAAPRRWKPRLHQEHELRGFVVRHLRGLCGPRELTAWFDGRGLGRKIELAKAAQHIGKSHPISRWGV